MKKNKKLLSILIPTFNRSVYLEKNLEILKKIVLNSKLEDDLEVIISNNFSTDTTANVIEKFRASLPELFIGINQKSNIGLEENALFLLGKSNSKYVMYLGDDDYLSTEYLLTVLAFLKNKKPSIIIPSYNGITPEGVLLGRGRDLDANTSEYTQGFYSCLSHSWRGHQLSGLTFLRQGVLKSYRKNSVNNIYPFIYFATLSLLQGNFIHLTDYPILVTAPPQNQKDWGYGADGLIGNVFDNYKRIEGLHFWQRSLLEIVFLDVQYWRYAMYLKVGLLDFLKALFKIFLGKNTSLLTQIIFPVLIPIILFKKTIELLIKGELLKTFKRKVEVN